MISLQIYSSVYSHYTPHMQGQNAWFFVSYDFLEEGNENSKNAFLFSVNWEFNDIKELHQLQLAQMVFATVPIDEINSNDWGAILASRLPGGGMA